MAQQLTVSDGGVRAVPGPLFKDMSIAVVPGVGATAVVSYRVSDGGHQFFLSPEAGITEPEHFVLSGPVASVTIESSGGETTVEWRFP